MNNYNGLKLTPNLFKEILINLFDGKQFERQDCIRRVIQFFQENGGIIESKDYTATFKSASKKLKDNGLVNLGYGVWTLNYKKKDIEILTPSNEVVVDFRVDKEIGNGLYALYVYYFDAYKKIADLENKSIWECKIGRTDRDPIQRVFGQVGTCYPEKPHLALIIYCEDSIKLENAVHSILKYKNRWIENAPGDEWFLTSPDEVENIYNNLL